jgi:hypothetical protein
MRCIRDTRFNDEVTQMRLVRRACDPLHLPDPLAHGAHDSDKRWLVIARPRCAKRNQAERVLGGYCIMRAIADAS